MTLRDLILKAKTNGAAVAVKRGRFQIQHVAYNEKGTAQIKPLSGWLTPAELKMEVCGRWGWE